MDDRRRRDLVAQWAFDTKPILSRFHLWLEDVEERWIAGGPFGQGPISFVGEGLERAFVMTAAVTALGTRLFGRYGEGAGLDRAGLNRVKKDADAASAYAMSEALWYLTRNLPENHALMVSLGEGLMPKVGETPEMGSNPLLGFGRVYARPQVARILDRMIHRMINDPSHGWDRFWEELARRGLTVWGAAIDTLENTSRFAKGAATGPMTVLHVFDQPLQVSKPYEGYMGFLSLPMEAVDQAEERSILLTYLTPRATIMEVLLDTYPGLTPDRVHVWTLGGKSRAGRIGDLWAEWREAGAHLVEEGWELPGGGRAFVESGTYAPTMSVGPFHDSEGRVNLFIADGYAASAEAIQAASLDPVLGLQTSMCLFGSKFEVPHHREHMVMRLDPSTADFRQRLANALGREVTDQDAATYGAMIRHARESGMPTSKRTLLIHDFFPRKTWQVLALTGYMLPDPYTGASGVTEVGPGVYRVTARAAAGEGIMQATLTLRLLEPMAESRLVFSPLLDRFYSGQDYRTRPVRISDSGRIRNELQTLASEAIEYLEDERMRVHLDRLDDEVLPADKKRLIREVLAWYKENHPIWFSWLEL